MCEYLVRVVVIPHNNRQGARTMYEDKPDWWKRGFFSEEAAKTWTGAVKNEREWPCDCPDVCECRRSGRNLDSDLAVELFSSDG